MKMVFKIKEVKAREVLDSRGNPTVECEIFTENSIARAIVPSGASKGIHEALELRDNGKRYHGKGVLKAVKNIKEIIAPKIIGKDCRNQREIDEIMLSLDGTENKSNLGANAILAVSMAVVKVSAIEEGIPLYERIGQLIDNSSYIMPIPFMNIINGGKHAGNKLDIQEYMIAPVNVANFKEAIRVGSEIYHELKEIIKRKYGKKAINVGDEGGFAPPLKRIEEPIKLIMKAIEKLDYANEVKLALDAAASEFYNENNKCYKVEGKEISADELKEIYFKLLEDYPIISLEDIFAQDDWESWISFRRETKGKVQIVGDDLLVTNIRRIENAIEEKACNALLLKVNQIGTISESLDAASLAFLNHWNVMVSHRSGETEDTFIADLAVGLGCGQIKAGA
ncbi:MAG: phosphopyruvate hydratase, partial [Candidatus Altiarchaeales archaeon]